MIMDNPGPAIFEADPADEFRLSFTVPDILAKTGRRTLMTMRCFEDEKLRGAIVWLGERQHLWPEWMAMANATSGAALSEHLVAMAAQDSLARFGSTRYMFERCCGASIEKIGKTGIELSLTLATRRLSVATHVFADAPSHAAFMQAIMAEDRIVGAVELAEFALLRGRQALARKLNSIAHERLTAAGGMVH